MKVGFFIQAAFVAIASLAGWLSFGSRDKPAQRSTRAVFTIEADGAVFAHELVEVSDDATIELGGAMIKPAPRVHSDDVMLIKQAAMPPPGSHMPRHARHQSAFQANLDPAASFSQSLSFDSLQPYHKSEDEPWMYRMALLLLAVMLSLQVAVSMVAKGKRIAPPEAPLLEVAPPQVDAEFLAPPKLISLPPDHPLMSAPSIEQDADLVAEQCAEDEEVPQLVEVAPNQRLNKEQFLGADVDDSAKANPPDEAKDEHVQSSEEQLAEDHVLEVNNETPDAVVEEKRIVCSTCCFTDACSESS